MNSTTVGNSTGTWEQDSIPVLLQVGFLSLGHLVSACTTFAIIYALWKENKFASIGSFNLLNLTIAWGLNMVMLNLEIYLDSYGDGIDGVFLCYIYPALARIPVTAEAFFLCYICTERSWQRWKTFERTSSGMLADGAQAWCFLLFVEAYWFLFSGREWIPLYREDTFKCYVIMDDQKKLQSFFMGLYVCTRCFVPGAIYLAHYRRLRAEIRDFDREPRVNLAESPAELEQDYKEVKSELKFMGTVCGSRIIMDMFDGIMGIVRSILPFHARRLLESGEFCLKYVAFFRCSVLPIGLSLANSQLRKSLMKIFKINGCVEGMRSLESLEAASGPADMETIELLEVYKGQSTLELPGLEGIEAKLGDKHVRQSSSQNAMANAIADAYDPLAIINETSGVKVTEMRASAEDSEGSSMKSMDNARRWADAWNPTPPEESCKQEELDCESIVETVSELYGYVRVPRIVVTPSPPGSEVSTGTVRTSKLVPMYGRERSGGDDSGSLADSENDSVFSGRSNIRSTRGPYGRVHFSYSGTKRQLPLIPNSVPFEIPGSSTYTPRREGIPIGPEVSQGSGSAFSNKVVEQGCRRRNLPEIPSVQVYQQKLEWESDIGKRQRGVFAPVIGPSTGIKTNYVGRKKMRFLPAIPLDAVDARLCAVSEALSVREKVKGRWV